MDPSKAEFKRLIEIMEWTQTEAAKRLAKTPSAINHLVNPEHPNKPTQTTLRLLKLIMARERPDLFTARTFELKATVRNNDLSQLHPRERDLIRSLRELSKDEQNKVYSVIRALLDNAPKTKTAKTRPSTPGARSAPGN